MGEGDDCVSFLGFSMTAKGDTIQCTTWVVGLVLFCGERIRIPTLFFAFVLLSFYLGFFFFCVFLIVLTCKVKDNTAIAFANRDTIEQYKAFLYLNRLFCFVLSKCQILPTMHLNHLNKFELEGSSSINCFFFVNTSINCV